MKRACLSLILILVWGIPAPVGIGAQPAEQPLEPTNEAPVKPTSPRKKAPRPRANVQDSVTIGSNCVIKEGEAVADMVVIAGDASIEGTVRGDLVVVAGTASIGPKGAVAGDAVVVAGVLDADPAQIKGERVVLGIGPGLPGVKWAREWVRGGLMMGRPLVPQQWFSWAASGVALLLFLALALLFPRPVQASVTALEERPGGAMLAGLLAFALSGPLVLLLVITVVGLVVVPFLLCAMVVVFLLGKVVVYRYAGQQFGAQTGLAALQQPLVALLVGALIFYLLYMVPVLGLVVWGVVAPLGVGAVLLAAFRSTRTKAATSAAVATPGAAVVTPGAAASAAATPAALRPRVGFWWRLFATLLDLILLGAALKLIPVRHVASYFLPVWIAYHVAMWAWLGATVGDMALGIKIVRVEGGPINFAVALVRVMGSFLSALAFFIGFFWAGWDPGKQSWHDKIAGTMVVKSPQGTAAV